MKTSSGPTLADAVESLEKAESFVESEKGLLQEMNHDNMWHWNKVLIMQKNHPEELSRIALLPPSEFEKELSYYRACS